MKSSWKCPVCRRPGKQTKEHVWPQWLRDSPLARDLLQSAHGERFPYAYSDLERTGGRLIATPRSVSVAKWVPQITAPVCTSCNSGWMSRLEARVKRALSPAVLAGGPVTIQGGGVRDVARWAVKTAMMYQGALKMKQACFTPDEVERMAKYQEIPSRCKVWVRSVSGPLQWIAMHYEGLVLPDAHDVAELSLRDNIALTLIGMPHLVVVVGVAPATEDIWLLDSLAPPSFGSARAPQIWPDPGRLILPTTESESDDFDPRTVFAGLAAMGTASSSSLPELTPEALSAVLEKEHGPSTILQAAIDQFCTDCDGEVLAQNSPFDSLLFGNSAPFTQEQLGKLFTAGLALVRRHADDHPVEVARRLNNLANALFSSKAYCASVLMAITCASLPRGGYDVRPDIWGLAGNAAWQVSAFHVAADLYSEQAALDPDDMVCRFNLAESLFMSGDFNGASAVMNDMIVEDQSVLADALACFRIALSLVLRSGLTTLDGFKGPNVEGILEMVMSNRPPNFDLVGSFRGRLLALVGELHDAEPESILITKAYITDSVDDWAKAATALLASNGPHPALMAVLRKGASCGPAFLRALEDQIEQHHCPTRLPDGTDAPRFVRDHAYPRRHRTIRLVDGDNRPLRDG